MAALSGVDATETPLLCSPQQRWEQSAGVFLGGGCSGVGQQAAHTQSTSAMDKGYNGAGRAGGGW